MLCELVVVWCLVLQRLVPSVLLVPPGGDDVGNED